MTGFGFSAALIWSGCSKQAAVTSGSPAFATQVVAVSAIEQAVSEKLSQIGTIAANEMVEIKSETDGVVSRLLFQEGQEVEAGRLLIELEQGKLLAALAEAEANFDLSRANYERAQQLFKSDLISKQEFDQTAAGFSLNQATVNLRKRQLKDTRILAPFGGLIGVRNVSPGQVISKSTSLTWLMDDNPVKVEFEVPERHSGRLEMGQVVQIQVAAFGDRRFAGEVVFISPYVDPNSRTSLVKARISNPKHELKTGMFSTLELVLEERERAVVVPEAALYRILEGDRATVWKIDSKMAVAEQEVSVGVRLPGRVEIRTGLVAGDRVVVAGVQKLRQGGQVVLASEDESKSYWVK